MELELLKPEYEESCLKTLVFIMWVSISYVLYDLVIGNHAQSLIAFIPVAASCFTLWFLTASERAEYKYTDDGEDDAPPIRGN